MKESFKDFLAENFWSILTIVFMSGGFYIYTNLMNENQTAQITQMQLQIAAQSQQMTQCQIQIATLQESTNNLAAQLTRIDNKLG